MVRNKSHYKLNAERRNYFTMNVHLNCVLTSNVKPPPSLLETVEIVLPTPPPLVDATVRGGM